MKKLISILLIVTMLLATLLAAIPASAEAINVDSVGNKVVTDANRDEYVATLPAGAVAVSSKSDLIGKVQNSKYYYLTSNITFSAGEFASAVSGTSVLTGVTIDGCGYTINIGGTSLFGKTKNLTVKNLTIDGSINSNNNSVYHSLNAYGSEGYVNIQNVTASVDITVINKTDRRSVGALAASISGSTVKNLLNEGNILLKGDTTKLDAIGGIFGVASNSTLENVVNKGSVTVEGISVSTTLSIGGIVGRSDKTSYKNCVNSGAITTSSKANETYVGGIVSYSGTKTVFNDCTNNGDITVRGDGRVTAIGGIMAMVSGDGAEIYGCINNGEIKMQDNARTAEPGDLGMGIGGILGITRSVETYIKDSRNNKSITVIASGTVAAGGVLGYQYNSKAATNKSAIAKVLSIEACANVGTITDNGSGAMLGGIAGAIRGVINTVIQESDNSGNVIMSGGSHAWRAAGGILGVYGSLGSRLTGGDRNLPIALDIYCCTNLGAVSNTNYAGGLLGHNEEMAADELVMTFYGCLNAGAVTSTRNNAAGIFGCPLSRGYLIVNYCENRGAVNGSDAGGIISTPSATFAEIHITNTKNSGDITGSNNAGGIAAKTTQELGSVTFEKCLNTGKVFANSTIYGLAGGMIGYSKSGVMLGGCVNTGKVTSLIEDMAYPISHPQTPIKVLKENIYLKGTADATDILHGSSKTAAEVDAVIATMSFQCANNPFNLNKAYADACKYYPQDHTEESWVLLGSARKEAEELLADPNAAQEDMDRVVVDIRNGISVLVLTGLRDFAGLEQAIIDGEEEGKNWYTLTWLELFKAIRDAKEILRLEDEEKEKLLQSDIDKASERIYQAIRDLIEKPPIQGEIDVEANGDFTVGTLRPPATTVTTTATTEESTVPVEESTPLLDLKDEVKINCNGLIGGGAIVLTALIAIGAGVAMRKKED